MSNSKRLSTTSVATESQMASAQAPQAPEWIELPDTAKPVFDNIVRARDYSSWSDVDLEHAANLACCLADLERLRREVREEGDTLLNARGTVVMNPKHTLMETLSRRSVALSRMLHVHAEATVGESRHQAKRSEKQREIQGAMNEHQSALDSLIPTPERRM